MKTKQTQKVEIESNWQGSVIVPFLKGAKSVADRITFLNVARESGSLNEYGRILVEKILESDRSRREKWEKDLSSWKLPRIYYSFRDALDIANERLHLGQYMYDEISYRDRFSEDQHAKSTIGKPSFREYMKQYHARGSKGEDPTRANFQSGSFLDKFDKKYAPYGKHVSDEELFRYYFNRGAFLSNPLYRPQSGTEYFAKALDVLKNNPAKNSDLIKRLEIFIGNVKLDSERSICNCGSDCCSDNLGSYRGEEIRSRKKRIKERLASNTYKQTPGFADYVVKDRKLRCIETK